MDNFDDVAPVYVPDQELNSDSDITLPSTVSLSNYSTSTINSEEAAGLFCFRFLYYFSIKVQLLLVWVS
jgi:hypothetical protein